MRITIRKGLNIPIAGEPVQAIADAPEVGSVALLGTDVHGLRPRLAVEVGDPVRLGQTLFIDKRSPEVRFAAPAAGRVTAINRGAKRALQSVVIELDGNGAETFPACEPAQLERLDGATVRETLLAAGQWPVFRTRPFSRIPAPDAVPAAIFVTAIDTNPLAADPAVVIAGAAESFAAGLTLLTRLTGGSVYVCTAADTSIRCPGGERFRHVEFAGPHPAGLAGTHIHFLEPVGESKTVWHLGYQDVIAIGELFLSGRLCERRVIALGGPAASRPRLLRTRPGARAGDLLRGETDAGRLRIISGSVLSGHRAAGPLDWLGRYHNQVSVLREGGEREFLAFVKAGTDRYSYSNAYLGRLLKRGGFGMTTTQNGSPRAMVPIGSFEKIMPLDVLATPLLKALIVEDTDRARELGCLELDEEDLALCSFVCNGKYEYGPFLRMNLDEIEAHG